MDICVFCKESYGTEPVTTLTAKGCEGIARACELRQETVTVVPGQRVHVKCRKAFCSCTKYSESFKK